MENKAHFGSLTGRMEAFREEVLNEKPYIDAQRAILATEAYKENLHQPRVMARANMLKKILELELLKSLLRMTQMTSKLENVTTCQLLIL